VSLLLSEVSTDVDCAYGLCIIPTVVTWQGIFYRMFNVTLPCNHWSPSNNKLGQAEPYEHLVRGGFVNRHEIALLKLKGDHHAPNVSPEGNFDNLFAREPHK